MNEPRQDPEGRTAPPGHPVLMLVLATIGFAVNFWAWALLSPLGYRQTVSPWFRSIFSLQPKPELMAAAPWGFRAHALGAWLLFAFWPFSRLVHVFSVPLGYLTRPYIVYRSRDERLGSREPRRGWEPVQ